MDVWTTTHWGLFLQWTCIKRAFCIFLSQKRPFDWQNLNDLKGLLLGGGLAYSYGEEFDKAPQAGLFDMSRVSTTEQNFKRLAMGRIDAFAEEKRRLLHLGQ